MHQSCASCNLETPCKDLVSMRRTDREVNPNLKPAERFPPNGRESESRLCGALNLPSKRLSRGRPGSGMMVVQKEVTMLCGAKGDGWLIDCGWQTFLNKEVCRFIYSSYQIHDVKHGSYREQSSSTTVNEMKWIFIHSRRSFHLNSDSIVFHSFREPLHWSFIPVAD